LAIAPRRLRGVLGQQFLHARKALVLGLLPVLAGGVPVVAKATLGERFRG
jgi:hypothetical protein